MNRASSSSPLTNGILVNGFLVLVCFRKDLRVGLKIIRTLRNLKLRFRISK
jgi:hypothetical protein